MVLDGASANVALPTLATRLQVSGGRLYPGGRGYQLALVMTLLPCAALGESLRLRRVFIGGVAINLPVGAVVLLLAGACRNRPAPDPASTASAPRSTQSTSPR